ncbi:hypothetical protein MRB53_023877 [Persea americana]|uniref:Uncharacterized protein n=1 Tax=Persea americana TaxID=3435 RepID=A0ACC2LBY8_PERAE|nr:hypothetical protein MRB53_023877 [Persea americana]
MRLQSEESEIDSMRKYVNIVITKTRGQNVKYHYRGTTVEGGDDLERGVEIGDEVGDDGMEGGEELLLLHTSATDLALEQLPYLFHGDDVVL